MASVGRRKKQQQQQQQPMTPSSQQHQQFSPPTNAPQPHHPYGRPGPFLNLSRHHQQSKVTPDMRQQQQPPPPQQQPTPRHEGPVKLTPDEAALTAKNYRLAKELVSLQWLIDREKGDRRTCTKIVLHRTKDHMILTVSPSFFASSSLFAFDRDVYRCSFCLLAVTGRTSGTASRRM